MSRVYKVIGFDFGLKYIGIAFGQSVSKTAKPLTTVKAKQGVPNWQQVEEIINTWQPNVLVVGVPLNMDGSEQPITDYAKKFASILEDKFDIDVCEVDERLSTWEAKSKLKIPYKDNNVSKDKLNQVNALSAAILVESWLSNAPT